jgi:hypothetical protein
MFSFIILGLVSIKIAVIERIAHFVFDWRSIYVDNIIGVNFFKRQFEPN